MADILRAYRRWLIRRLSYLLPLFLGALATNVWLAVYLECERWLKVISVAFSGLSLAALGYLVFETLVCALLQARGERRAARTLRGHLAMSWRVSGACVIVIAALIVGPSILRTPEPERPPEAFPRRSFVEVPPLPPAEFTQLPPVEERPPALAAAERAGEPEPAAKPDIRPVAADVPPRLVLEEKELDPPIAVAPFPREPQEPARPAEQDPTALENLPFRLEPVEPSDFPGPAWMGVDRPGLRNEEKEDPPPPTFRLDVLLLSMEGYGRGGGASLEGDYAVSRDGSVHAGYLGVGFGHGRELDELKSEWVWHRLTLGYLHRVLGYTRHAPFDLAVTAGASVDVFSDEGGPEEIDEKARFSPYAAVDLGLWQGGPVGFVFHAGQSLPFNLTGSTSSVTDVSATLRLDVSERFSLFAGYRLLWVQLKEYPEKLASSHATDEFDSALAGPLIGLEYRF